MKKCLVLGAGGFIGSNLCRTLSELYDVRAFDIRGMEDLQQVENVEVVYGDFVQMTDYTELLQDVDIVYHLICTTIPKDDTTHIEDEIQKNLIPLTRLLEQMVRRDIDNFVFISSAGTIYGEGGMEKKREQDALCPVCSYGALKEACEAYIQFYNSRYGKKYRIARVTNPYGAGQRQSKKQGIIPIFMNRLLNGEGITVFGTGENVRDYIFIPDLIDALVKLGQYTGDVTVYNVGCGKTYSIREVISLIETTAGMQFTNIDYSSERFCDVMISDVNLDRLHSELQWHAKTELEEGISILWNYFKDENGVS